MGERPPDISKIENLNILRLKAMDVDQPVFENYIVVLIQHLLLDTLPTIYAFSNLGATVTVIGIPYWYDKEVINLIKQEKGERVDLILPPCDEIEGLPSTIPFYDRMKKLVKAELTSIIKRCKDEDKKLLIVEDGGYAVPLLHEETDLEDGLKLCVGAVEQTTRGMNRDRDIHLKFPVLTIAKSRVKGEIEAPYVGREVANKIQTLLRDYRFLVGDETVTIVGFGSIGEKVAEEMKKICPNVCIVEPNYSFRRRARRLGYETADNVDYFLKKSNIAIGCTGRTSINVENILKTREAVILASSSSGREEIDIWNLEHIQIRKAVIDGVGTEYIMPRKMNPVTVLAHGFPVNFFQSKQSLPMGAIDPVLTELFLCAKYLVCLERENNMDKILQPGLYIIGVKGDRGETLIDENEIKRLWDSIYRS